MTRKGRRIEIWLEEDHPIFDYPPGLRSTMIRTLLNQGMMFDQILNELQTIKDGLNISSSKSTDQEIHCTEPTKVVISDFLDL